MSVAPPLLAALALLLLPGALVGAALGLRGWLLVGSAPALTVGAAGVVGAWFGVTGIHWSLLTALVGLLVLTAVLAAIARPWRRAAWRPALAYRWYHSVAVGGALVVSTALGALVVTRGTLHLQGIPQYWDAMFHANAIRYIAQSGSADPSALAAIGQPANHHFYYPQNYHLLGALLFEHGGWPVQVVLNAMSACLPAVFALSLVALLRVALPRPATVFAGALVASLFASFPYDLINFGPLLPLALAIAVAPGVVAAVLALLRTPSMGLAGAVVVGVVGLLTTHPTVAVAMALVVAALVLVGPREDQVWRDRRRLLIAAATAVAALVVALPSVRGLIGPAGQATAIDWPAVASPGSAAGQLLLLNQDSPLPQWWLAFAVLVGAVLALRNAALRPFLVAAGGFLALYVLAAAYDTPLAQTLTAVWWNDRWRLAALYVVPAAVLAAAGLTWAVDAVRQGFVRSGEWVARRRAVPRWPAPLAGVAAVGLVAVAFLVVTSGGYHSSNAARVAVPYRDGPTVYTGERQAYQELAHRWSGGAILNDPADGSPWAYALYGLPVVFKTPLTPPANATDLGKDRLALLDHFDDGLDDPAVARAVQDLDVRWVIVGDGFASPSVTRAPGLRHLDDMPGVHLVWSDDVARIYRVDRNLS